jgi:hypothetical protein
MLNPHPPDRISTSYSAAAMVSLPPLAAAAPTRCVDVSSEAKSSALHLSKSSSMHSSSSPSPRRTTAVAPSVCMHFSMRLPTALKCSYCLLPRPKIP